MGRANANPNTARTTDGATPVLFASQENNVEVFDCLIEAKCTTLNTPNNNSITPVNAAAYMGHLNMVQRLVELKTDLNIKDKWGDTPLTNAKSENHTTVVDFLSSLPHV